MTKNQRGRINSEIVDRLAGLVVKTLAETGPITTGALIDTLGLPGQVVSRLLEVMYDEGQVKYGISRADGFCTVAVRVGDEAKLFDGRCSEAQSVTVVA